MSDQLPQTEDEFFGYWGRVIVEGKRLSDEQFRDLLSAKGWPDALNEALSQLSARMILTKEQAQKALELVKTLEFDCSEARRDLKALITLLDPFRGPMYKLQTALNLEADWAAVMAISEVLPYYCRNARQAVLDSDRPDSIKTELIKVINAHQAEMRL